MIKNLIGRVIGHIFCVSQSPTKSSPAKKALPFTHASYGLSSKQVHELKIKGFRKFSIWYASLLHVLKRALHTGILSFTTFVEKNS